MSRKVFLSFLGGGAYRPCTYSREGLKFEDEQFIQIATLKYLMSKEPWNENDSAYIFLTQGAHDANWVDEGITLWDKKPKIGAVGLERRLKELNTPFPIHPIFGVKDGNNEDEILEIFSRVYDCISDGDLLYLDITHGFRYLPMLMVVLGNYAKFLKKVEIKSITYGNFEFLGTEKPIIDLLPLASIQDWAYAAGQYLECGNVDRLVSLGKAELIPILKASNGQDEDAKNLRSYLDRLKDVIEERRMCRGLEIIKSKSLFQLKKLGNVVEHSVIPLMSPILSGIDKTFDTFDDSPNVKNGLSAAVWCYKNGLYQQSATLLEESMVSIICERNSLPIDDRSMRELVNSAFMIKYTELDESLWNEKCILNKDTIHTLLSDELLCKKDLLRLFDMVSKLRNDYNHAGMRAVPEPVNSTNLKRRLYEQLQSAAKIFNIEINCN